MTAIIEPLNSLGIRFTAVALPMALQSSVLILLLFALDLALRKKARATIRYAVWMLVLVKFALPPSLASPTSAAYWLHTETAVNDSRPIVVSMPLVEEMQATDPAANSTRSIPPGAVRPGLTKPAVIFMAWIVVGLALGIWVIGRLRKVVRVILQSSEAPPEAKMLLDSCRQRLEIKRAIALRCAAIGTPAICGVFRPIILIPHGLAENLEASEMQLVLLHELAHYKRGDLWVNHVQILLQVIHWYNPLLWLANATIRRAREQAADEMVLVEMAGEAPAYPTTLLHVAKLSLGQPVVGLGLLGILESGRGLAQRITHIMSRPLPRTARIGASGMAAVIGLAVIALPMGCRSKAASGSSPSAMTSAQPMGGATNDELVLAISQEGVITLRNETVTLDGLRDKLAEAVRQNPRTRLVIKADETATWTAVRRVLDAAEAAHISGINLAATLDTQVPSGTKTAGHEATPVEIGEELGEAVVRGDPGALEKLSEMAKAAYASFSANRSESNGNQGGNSDHSMFMPLNAAFRVINGAAATSNQVAVAAVWRSVQMPYLQGNAIQGLGIMAGAGNEAAVEALVNPDKYGFLLSSTVGALKAAADRGSQKAIDALVAVARNPRNGPLFYMTADGLGKSAAAGNEAAIDGLISMLESSNPQGGRFAYSRLQTVANNGNQKAIAALAEFAKRAPAPVGQPAPPARLQEATDLAKITNAARESGMAVVRGEPGALDKLREFLANERPSSGENGAQMTREQRLNAIAPINAAFAVIVEAAAKGNSNAVDAVWQAARIQDLKGLAVRSLGAMAAAGNEPALEALTKPEKYGFVLSTTISALKPAAETGNQKAIDVLAALTKDAHNTPLWFLTAQSLQKPAEAGNAVAIDAMIRILASTNINVRGAALPPLQTAAANHNAQAAEALRAMDLELPPRSPFK